MKRLFSLYINKVYTGSVFSIVLCLPLFLLTSCGVHELPEDGGVDPTVVHTTIVLLPGADMTPFDIPDFSTRAAAGHTYEVRYQVEVYADDKYDQNLQFRRTLTYPEGYTGEVALECDLHARNYRVVAWRDFVPAGTSDDCFYSTEDFSAIKLNGDYVGGTDYKDVFSGQVSLNFTSYHCDLETEHREEMRLERPLAKIMLVTTDVIKYFDNLKQTENKIAADDRTTSRTTDVEDLTLKVLYSGYFPTGFDLSLNRPNKVDTGVSFSSVPISISDTEACLAFDYVLVNGAQSAVTVDMIIYNKDGVEVNSIGGVEIPIERNKITTVRDAFLTRDFDPSIGVDPSFNGEINVVIP